MEGVIYAAKIIDLRPFKLRERFSMQRWDLYFLSLLVVLRMATPRGSRGGSLRSPVASSGHEK